MRKKFFFTTIIFLLSALFILKPVDVNAARLYFSNEPLSTGENKIVLLMDAKEAVNTFEIAVNIPSGVSVRDINDGNSIIKFWIERPVYNSTTRTIKFSGIVPEGFRGNNTILINFIAEATTDALITVDKNSVIYLNTESGIKDTLELEPVRIRPHEGNGVLPEKDTEVPENFIPIVVREPLLYDGNAVVIFKTEDKKSGIAFYEIVESVSKTIAWDESTPGVYKASSPYVLKDQSLQSYIHIRAVDNAGNVRQVTVSPQKKSLFTYGAYLFWGILILSFVMMFVLFLRRK